jgi:hypothetical protein
MNRIFSEKKSPKSHSSNLNGNGTSEDQDEAVNKWKFSRLILIKKISTINFRN